MCRQTQGQTQRVPESHSRGSLSQFYGTFFPTILIFLVHCSCLVYFRIVPCVHTHLLAKVDFMSGSGGLLTLRMRNMWSGQGPASSLNCSASLILQSQSTGNESLVTLPCGGQGRGECIYLLSQNFGDLTEGKTVNWVRGIECLGKVTQHRGKQHGISMHKVKFCFCTMISMLLLLSHFSRVRLCATPQTAAHQAPPSLVFI